MSIRVAFGIARSPERSTIEGVQSSDRSENGNKAGVVATSEVPKSDGDHAEYVNCTKGGKSARQTDRKPIQFSVGRKEKAAANEGKEEEEEGGPFVCGAKVKIYQVPPFPPNSETP